jgi:tetratricopeptide (TPR) repeat protein
MQVGCRVALASMTSAGLVVVGFAVCVPDGRPHGKLTTYALDRLGDSGALEIRAELRLAADAYVRACPYFELLQQTAVDLRSAGLLDEAELIQRAAIDRAVALSGPECIEAASAYSATGMLLHMKGDVLEARGNYDRALAIRRKALGPEAEATQLVQARLTALDTAALPVCTSARQPSLTTSEG